MEPEYRQIAIEVASKYAELCGCTPADIGTLTTTVQSALGLVAPAADQDDPPGQDARADLTFDLRAEEGHVLCRISVRGAASALTFRCPCSAPPH